MVSKVKEHHKYKSKKIISFLLLETIVKKIYNFIRFTNYIAKTIATKYYNIRLRNRLKKEDSNVIDIYHF